MVAGAGGQLLEPLQDRAACTRGVALEHVVRGDLVVGELGCLLALARLGGGIGRKRNAPRLLVLRQPSCDVGCFVGAEDPVRGEQLLVDPGGDVAGPVLLDGGLDGAPALAMEASVRLSADDAVQRALFAIGELEAWHARF
jgi:hypothetical protein